MTNNIYTPHRAERIYDSRNNEVRYESRHYAPNFYEERYPERSLSSGRYIDGSRRDSFDSFDRYESFDRFDSADCYAPVSEFFEEPAERMTSRPQPQPKKSRAGLAIATVALTLAMVFSVGTVVFFATKDNNKLTNGSQNSVSTVSSDAAAKSAGTAETSTAQTAAADSSSQSGVTPAMTIAQRVYAGHSLEQTAEENIVKVDGERVYIDTKRPVPDTTGSYLHFNESGMTSYGFDWTYTTDNANFVIRCDYNFARQQYDFQFYGVTPGTANVTVWYNTSDYVQVPVQLTINVDNDLNVTQA